MQYTLLHFLGCFPVSKSSLDQNSSRYTSQHRKRQPCHAMQIILSRPLVHPPPQPLPLVKPTTTQPEQHYFLPTEAPKFVLCFLVSLVSVSLSSAAAPALFLCFFEPPPAPDLFALVALVGVAWLEPPSLSPLRKDVERGVGARAATGVDAAVSIGVSPPFPKLTLLLLKTLFPSTTTKRLLCPGTLLTPFVYASNPIIIFPYGVSSRYSVSLRRISAS